MTTAKSKRIKFKSLAPIVATEVYDTFWKFAYRRQVVFLDRLLERESSIEDEILSEYKFTNSYRVCDRVSQYLVKNVIYSESFSVEDTFLRIILFKLFNKIETWELMENKFGVISSENFSVDRFKPFLDSEMNSGRTLYSNAYMMASGSKEFDVTRKHHSHLLLVKKMLDEDVPKRIEASGSMKAGYDILLSYPLIGKFLAYQYITDINYSEITDYTENEFTVPGPGARDGIRKCFSSLGGLSESEVIKLLQERQEMEFERLGIDFPYLGERKLQYIDIQNLFCETDKYSRVAHPTVMGLSGRSRIKQKYKPNKEKIDYFFPPKWKINVDDLYGYR